MAKKSYQLEVERDLDKIKLLGDLGPYSFRRPLAVLHQAVESAGFSELRLDFSNLDFVSPVAILALCAQIMRLRVAGIYTSICLPEDKSLQRLFINANWAHFLDPRSFDPGRSRATTRLPATHYTTSSQQTEIVNEMVQAMLSTVDGLERAEIQALEWALNEITDNVLVHAESKAGGLVQVSYYPRKNYVQFIVADAGIGIPESLRQSGLDITSEVDALDRAIREGVTRDKSLGQGNGLFGTYEICRKGEGTFHADSLHASLNSDRQGKLSIRSQQIPYQGTLVSASLDFSKPGLLRDALRLRGKKYSAVDFIETHYEAYECDDFVFRLAEESNSFGSRVAGAPIRKRLHNLLRMSNDKKLIVDCIDVELVSSSFADEVFAKLFLEIGPVTFATRVELRNVSPLVEDLINKAIVQRTKTGL